MSAPVSYFDVIRHMPNAFDYRLRLATHAHQHGIKATARAFSTTTRTARKWLRRYRDQGLKGLQEHSRAPLHQRHQTSPEAGGADAAFFAVSAANGVRIALMCRLIRYDGFNHAHFITTSTYRSAPLFDSELLGRIFVRVLGEVERGSEVAQTCRLSLRFVMPPK